MTDLSDQNPEKKAELLAAWDEYVERFNIIPANRHGFEQMEKRLPARGSPQTEEYPVMVGPVSEQYQRLLDAYEAQARQYYSWR